MEYVGSVRGSSVLIQPLCPEFNCQYFCTKKRLGRNFAFESGDSFDLIGFGKLF